MNSIPQAAKAFCRVLCNSAQEAARTSGSVHLVPVCRKWCTPLQMLASKA